MTLNEMQLRRPSPSALFPPTIKGFFALEGALTVSPNSLKSWWPGTELNRRRQPFQGCALPPELPGHFRNPLQSGCEGCPLRAYCGGIAKPNGSVRILSAWNALNYNNRLAFPQPTKLFTNS